MESRKRTFQCTSPIILILGLILVNSGTPSAEYFVEKLNRGVSAVKTGDGYLVSWRLLGHENYNTGFNVYKGTQKLNSAPITDATCYQDNSSEGGDYTVTTVINGVEGKASEKALVLPNGYIDIPLNPPSGASANDCSTGDLDGDGQLDIVLKWEGANAQDNSKAGVTGNVYLEGLTLAGKSLWKIDLGPNIRAGQHYTQHIVFDLDGDGIAEIVVKTAPGTKDGTGKNLNKGAASGADHSKVYRNSSGYILQGPEWLTVFNGATGAEMSTIDYNPPRGDVAKWGDSYGNRVDRFTSTVAYLDGERPSAVFERGYYTRTTLWAIDWRGGKLTERWLFDGNNYTGFNGNGNHGIMSGDADGDGKDEIINGAMCVDDNGKGLWTAKLGHGDAAHFTDIDPSRPGLEVWGIHENAQVGSALLDAKTGEIIWKTGAGDVGRGVAADLVASSKGLECWGGTSGLRSCTNGSAGSTPSSSNFLCWWDGDLLRELLNGTSISKYGGSSLLSASGCSQNNDSKAVPGLVADLFGDWREEAVWRTSDNKHLRVYSTPNSTKVRLYTLMHDHHYRCQVAEEQAAYNQPPHPGFYLGDGMDLPQEMPEIKYYDGGAVNVSKSLHNMKSIATHNLTRKVNSAMIFTLPNTGKGFTNSIMVFNLSGKAIKSFETVKSSISLSDFGIAEGVYLIKIVSPKVLSSK